MSLSLIARSKSPSPRSEHSPFSPAGGKGVPRFLAGGFSVSRPGDAVERNADTLAASVMQKGSCSGCAPLAPCAECASDSAGGLSGNAQPNRRLAGLGGGTPLDRATRGFFEPRFGRDLASVRVHAGQQDAGLASSLSASAFAVGDDIVFGEGRYEPHSERGRQLLAHELAHVVTPGDGGRVSRQVDAGVPDAGLAPSPTSDAGGPTDAGVPLPAGVPAAPAPPLFDSLYGTCLTEEEGRRRDAFALRHFHLDRNIPSTTFGMFDTDYWPVTGLMLVSVKMK
ncbi:MAG: DUF4157 domain-containing protein, partial [Proteobacteria bacterium]|nr:DUF4157 domain-containing protein [Pseudomonadota bacterium]